MIYLYWVLIALATYILGSVPFGFIVGKIKGIDIRTVGSKNVGSTNVTRVLGFKYGVLTFLMDCLVKGTLPILIITYVFGESYYIANGIDFRILYGSLSVIGHIFPLFLKFKGGKAVATGVGVIIGFSPILGLSGIAFFFIILFLTGYASVGSIIATSLVGIGLVFEIWLFRDANYSRYAFWLIFTFLIVFMIIFKHRKNIRNLINGTENKFVFGKKKKALLAEKNKESNSN